ncbi:GNAT family N-acetyltransferase [Bacillus sp. AFS031507]|uniref:GNAT family N-acetyltransferase n=1 Tax=Bacillus sp. AFS031507 TaxID=2033496 RepID=UPI000BFC0A7C|nr:GNAT family protein [Bacillus sp. AFS031507]PGY14179.1 GNAT family N-acetyltransferase [Bacillus sp. AFS031507]
MDKLWNNLFSLQGENVNLIPISMDHLEGLWEAAKPNEIWTYMATKVRSKNEMEQMIKAALKARENGSEYTFTVVNNENQVIGSTRFLDISPRHKSAEIGSTWYHPDVWRTKVNTECKFLLLTHAFENWNLTRVQLKTDSRNERSQQAIARIGAVKEGILRKDRIISDGYTRDTVFFSILCHEWDNVRTELKLKLQ